MTAHHNIHIVGLGRIGRHLIHICAEHQIGAFIYDKEVSNVKSIAHLLKYDSIYGRSYVSYLESNNTIIINNTCFCYSENYQNADIVIDCTGKNISANNRIILSYPSTSCNNNFIFGTEINDVTHRIISNTSCTTQAIGCVIDALLSLNIEIIYFTTIHAYTNDQELHDSFHNDARRARSATLSMIPTSTGADKMLAKAFPNIIINGHAIRVPTPSVSCVNISFVLNTIHTDTKTIIDLLKKSKYIFINYEPLVSVDFLKRSENAIIDYDSINIITKDHKSYLNMRIWYDNEYGYAYRLYDLLRLVIKDLQKSTSPHNKD